MTLDTTQLQERLQAALGPNYRLERSLGQGGMGVVFLARDLTLDREVAVKVVHPELAVHGSIAQRFLSEARLIAKLRHPNIIPVHAAGEAPGLFWYVMDYVAGETLRDRINRDGTCPHALTRQLIADLAGALDAAGKQGVVHRDVKPENILLDPDGGRPLLADFGVARVFQGLADGAAPITAQGVAVGTPTYMSPEQASGDPVDHRSDLYALGIVAYEMLTGLPPFRGSPSQVAAQQINVPPAAITGLVPDLPDAVAVAIMKALEKAPRDRFQSGAQFRDALLAEAPPVQHRSSLTAWAVVVGVAAMAIITTLMSAVRTGPPRGVDPRHSIVILPFDNLRGDTTLNWLEEGAVSMLGLTMAQWKDMTVVDQERVHDLIVKRGLESGQPVGLDAARAIAKEAGVWSLVVGDFVRTGDSLHVAARLIDVASGQRVDLAQADILATGDVRPAFDQLAAQLLDVSGAPGGLRPGLAAATTSSVDAYRTYLSGIDRLNHWDLTAADSILRATVQRDPEFALAWFKLALTRGWIVGQEDSIADVALAQAMRNVDRLPVREQTLIRGYRAFLDGEYARSADQFRSLLAKDSTDTDAWYLLADTWYHRPTSGAVEQSAALNTSLHAFRRALAIDPTYALAYEHVAEMFRDLSRPAGPVVLVAHDSFAPADPADQRTVAASVARARHDGIDISREWVVNQPETPRAQRALVEAYAAAGAISEADRELGRFVNMGGFHEPVLARITSARIRFGAGDVADAAGTLAPLYDTLLNDRTRLTRAAAEDWSTLLSGMNALVYSGDLVRAARVTTAVQRARVDLTPDPTIAFDPRHLAELQIGTIYTAAGGTPGPLREAWRTVSEAARRAPAGERAAIARSGTPAAVGLLIGPAHDPAPLAELHTLTGQEPPREVQALLAIAAGDTATARRLLLGDPAGWENEDRSSLGGFASEAWPLRAYGLLELHEPQRALDLLQHFDVNDLDPQIPLSTFGTVGMIRMLRGMAYERLDRRADAAREYRAVLAQWDGVDPKLFPYLNQVRLALGRVTGSG